MNTYTCLSGTRYTVQARTPEEAEQKLMAYWHGGNCPCGKPQWAVIHAEEIGDDNLCTCVEKDEVDTSIQIIHASGEPIKHEVIDRWFESGRHLCKCLCDGIFEDTAEAFARHLA